MTQTPSYIIRPMRLSDVERVYAIELASHVEPWTQQIIKDCINVQYTCLVLEDQQQIKGYLIAQIAVEECHLFNICIDKQAQRQGYGAYLLKHLLHVAKQQGAQAVILEVRRSNLAALAMYQKFGFEQIGVRKDYYPCSNGREDAIIHRLEL